MAGFWGNKDDGSVSAPTAQLGTPKPDQPKAGLAAVAVLPVAALEHNAGHNAGTLHFVGAGTKLKGNVHFSASATIDGILEGEVFCAETLVIGKGGSIVGPIRCNALVVQGICDGPVKVEKVASLKAGGILNGQIEAGGLQVEEGAVLNATVKAL